MLEQKQKAYSEWLVLCFQQGDQGALNSLFRLWEKRLLLYAIRRLGGQDKAEIARDVTQEALISISRSLHNLSDPAAFPAWAFRIVERRCVDYLRIKIREREVFASVEEVPELSKADNTENEITSSELLSSLDPKVRVVLQLHYLEDMTVGEISQVLDIPAGTVKSRLFYARKLIQSRANQKNSATE